MQLEVPETEDYAGFHEALRLINDRIMTITKECGSEIIKDPKKATPAAIESNFANLVKTNQKVDSATGKVIASYAPSIRLKLSLSKDTPESSYDDESKWATSVVDVDKKPMDKNVLRAKNNLLLPKFDVTGVFVSKTGISIQAMLTKVMVLAKDSAADDGDADDAFGGDACDAIKELKRKREEVKAEEEEEEKAADSGFGTA